MHKKCNKCGQEKPLSKFHRQKDSKDGYRNDCGECHNEMTRAWKRANRGHVAEYNRAWREANPERVTELRREWNSANPEKVAKMKRVYQIRNPQKYAARKAVTYATQSGKMPPAKDLDCTECGGQAQEYHHHKGYDDEHWLDVIPVCKKCHVELENLNFSEVRCIIQKL